MIKTPENQQNKLTPEELVQFRDIHKEYDQLIFDLGLLEIDYDFTQEKLNTLDKNKKDILSNLKSVNEKRMALNVELSTKYGDKQVDLETGDLK
jgi:hypothetical protein